MKQKIIYGNDLHLSYAEYGDRDGYPILIQHGLIASIDSTDLFNRLIASGLRLICVARPGYGESSPYLMNDFAEWGEILAPLLNKLELSQFDVLGMSSGAPYGYSIGHRFPAHVRSIYIFSGMPALFDDMVRSHWPYGVIQDTSIEAMKKLTHELFFADLTTDDLQNEDIRDSLMNNGFGVAQDLRLRFMDWGFNLSDVKANVFMSHSKCDEAVPYQTAVRTAELLPNCSLTLMESGPHFSKETLDDFFQTTLLEHMEPTQ